MIADQHPQWWRRCGNLLLTCAVVAVGILADRAWPLAGLLAVLAAGCGAALCGRADRLARQRMERPAQTARLERELGLGDDPSQEIG